MMSARATDVAGDLELGSAGRERAGQAHDQDLLAGARFPDVEEDGRVELEAVLRAGNVSPRPRGAGRIACVCCIDAQPWALLPRFGRATRPSLRPFRSALRSSRDGRHPLVTQPSRADVARETSPHFSCGTLCYMHGPAHPGSRPRPSPWLRPSANVSRPEAPFLHCTRASGRAYNNDKWQCQPSEGEALSAWALGVEALRPVLDIPQRTTIARPDPRF